MASYNNTPFSGGSSFGAPASPFVYDNPFVQKNKFTAYSPFQTIDLFRPDSVLYNPKKVPQQQPNNYAPTYFTDYNDPYTINSIADLLLNREGRARRYGEWARKPITGTAASAIIGSADLLWNQTLKPLIGNTAFGYKNDGLGGAVKGLGKGAQQAGLNALVNIGETMDMLGNPVKAALIEGAKALNIGDYGSKYEGDVMRALQNAMGWGTEGRVNYDWDTGNFFTDLVLEIVSDPSNWITLGGKTALTEGAERALSKSVKAVAGEGSEGLTKKIAKQFAKAYASSSDDIASVATRFFARNKATTLKNTQKVFTNPYLNKLVDGVLTPQQATALSKRVIQDMQNAVLFGVDGLTGPNIMRAARSTVNFVDKAEKSFLKAALYTSGVGEAYQIGKRVTKATINPIIKKLNDIPEKVAAKSFNTARSIVQESTDPAVRLLTEYADTLDELKKPYFKKLQGLYVYSSAVAAVVPSEPLQEFVEVLGKEYIQAQLPMDPVTKFIYQKIAPLYKTGYLSSVGFPMRNTFDGLFRNAIAMGGLENLGTVTDDFIKAIKDDKIYQDILKDILDYGKAGYPLDDFAAQLAGKTMSYSDTLTPELISAYYRDHKVTGMPIDVFMNYNRVIHDASSVLGGPTSEVRNIITGGNSTPKIRQLFDEVVEIPDFFTEMMDEIEQALEARTKKNLIKAKVYRDMFEDQIPGKPAVAKQLIADAIEFSDLPVSSYDPKQFAAYLGAKYKGAPDFGVLSKIIDKNPILQMNEAVERGLRWSMYQQQRNMGRTHGEAVQRIIKDHFVYDNKPFALKNVETYFPFTGFTLKNFGYWADMVSDASPYAFADRASKISLESFEKLIKDAKKVPKYNYKAHKVYDTTVAKIAKKYLGNVSELTGKQFSAHLRHFLNAHPYIVEENIKTVYKNYMKSLAKPGGAGAYFNNIMNMMTPIMDLDSLSNPDLYDYPNRERPDTWSMTAEHPYMNPSAGVLFNIFNGNIRYGEQYLDKADPKQRKVLQAVFKFNPSWMDAFQFGTNPVEAVGERLLPFLSNTIDWAQDTDGYKTNLEYFLDSVPILGTAIQRVKPIKNRWESTGDPTMFIPSIFGTVSQYPQFDPENPMENPSPELVKLWYGQYKGNNLQHNPYDTYPEYSNRYYSAPDDRSAVEKILARQYAIYKSAGLPEEYDPYVRYPNLAQAAHMAQLSRYGVFDPNNVDPNASKDAVSFWYRDYKQKGLSKAFNPYQYYPQYQTFPTRTYEKRTYAPKEPPTPEKQMARYYAMFKSQKLPEKYNPYTFFPELAQQIHDTKMEKYGAFNPFQIDTKASKDAINFWYRDYKQKGLDKWYNPYRYYTSPKTKATPKTLSGSTDYQNLKGLYNNYYSGTGTASRPGTTYYRQTQRLNRMARPRNFYKSMYTSTGLSRMQLRMGKLNSRSLKYRVSDMKYLIKQHWKYIR